jgi:4-amino-4-deoxy-L-arabinose transferase-like glycosyltransferase
LDLMSLDTISLAPPKDRNGDSTPGQDEDGRERDERAVLMETEPAPRPAERRLHIETLYEPPAYRLLFLLVALAVAGLHLAFSHAYWAPGHSGNNQNAYLVAGKLLATTGTTGFEPTSPFQFVGWMWNMADGASTAPGGGWHYPKYPVGLPLINALVYTAGKTITGDPWTGIAWTFKVSPVSVALSTLAIFFITRLLAGSFPAVLAMIAFSTLTVVVVLTNNPNSHAPDMAFVTWGMYALLLWWQRGGWWRGAIAGFLIGYAATIRYTEGLLVLPLLGAVLCVVRWRDLRSWARVSVPVVAWAFPLGVLVIFNLLTVGSLTGYDSTNESTGFTLAELRRKWRWGIDQFYNTGLYVLLPLAVGGMLMAFRWNWRVAVLLVLWFVPGTLLYLAYYWGMNLPVWGFLRFFASVLPAGVIAAVWMLRRAAYGDGPAQILPAWTVRRGALVTLLTLAVGAGAFGLASLTLDRAGDRP